MWEFPAGSGGCTPPLSAPSRTACHMRPQTEQGARASMGVPTTLSSLSGCGIFSPICARDIIKYQQAMPYALPLLLVWLGLGINNGHDSTARDLQILVATQS